MFFNRTFVKYIVVYEAVIKKMIIMSICAWDGCEDMLFMENFPVLD